MSYLPEIVLALSAVLLNCQLKPVRRKLGLSHGRPKKLMQPAAGERGDQCRDHGRYMRMGEKASLTHTWHFK